jgi:hypothetical protein
MKLQQFGVAAALVAILVLPVTAFAGGKHGSSGASTAGCTVSNTTLGGVVQATGLPTDQVINFMVTDTSGTTGWVLGFTPDGTWSVNVAAATGPTTYQFVSRTYGPDGSKYTVFANCSV